MEFIKYTIGLECWVKKLSSKQNEILTPVKVEFEKNEAGTVVGTLVSGRNLDRLPGYKPVSMTTEQWENRHYDPYDRIVEAEWGLSLFGIHPAALENGLD